MSSTLAIKNGLKDTAIGSLPSDWGVATLTDVSKSFHGGGTPKTGIKDYWNGDIPWTTTAIVDEDDTILKTYQKKISAKGLENSSSKLVRSGNLLLGTRVGVGKAVITPFDVAINQDFTAAILKDEFIGDLFLSYVFKLSRIQKWFDDNKRGATIKGVPREDVLSIKFPLPARDERQKIVTVLETIRKAIDLQVGIVEKTKELKKSLMQKLFTEGLRGEELKETKIGMIPKSWDVKTVDSLVLKANQRDPRKLRENEFVYIDVSSVSNETYSIIDSSVLLGKNAPSRARKVVLKNDIIIATVRPLLKRIALIDEQFDNQICSTGYCVLRSDPAKINPLYLFYAVQRDEFIESLGRVQRGVSYPAVTDCNVKAQSLPYPLIDEQMEIAVVLQNLDHKISIANRRRKYFEQLFQSMLHQLMTGQVRVKDLDVADE